MMKVLGNVKDIDEIWDFVERRTAQLTGNTTGPKLAAEVKSLGEELTLELEREKKPFHYMIFNLQQDYKHSLEGFSDYRKKRIYGIAFGIWIFECGEFENKGIGSYENWTFGGYKGGNFSRHGEPVKLFLNKYCPFYRNEGEGRIVTFHKIEE